MKKSQKIIFLTVLLVLFMMPVVLAGSSDGMSSEKYGTLHPQQNQIDAMRGTAVAFKYFFSGDLGEAMSWLLVGGAVYLIGTFFLIYYIMIFILKISLMKGDEHKGARNGIAIGFSLLGTATPQIYGFTVSFLGGTGLIVVLLAFIFYTGFIMFKNFGSENTKENARKYKENAESFKAKSEETKERMASIRLDNEETLEGKLQKDENALIGASKKALKNDLSVASNMASQLLAMRAVLTKLAGIQDGAMAAQHRKSVAAQASAFTNELKAGEGEIADIRSLTKKLEIFEFKDLKLEADEAQTLKVLKSNLLNELKEFHKIPNVNDTKYKDLKKEFSVFEPELERELHEAHNLDIRRKNLLEEARSIERRIVQQYEDIKLSQEEMVQALNTGTKEGITRAINAVNNSIHLEASISKESQAVIRVIGEQGILLRDRNALDKRIQPILNNIRTISV